MYPDEYIIQSNRLNRNYIKHIFFNQIADSLNVIDFLLGVGTLNCSRKKST